MFEIKICDLSPHVIEGADVTNYLSLPHKNRSSFVSEILGNARMGRLFSDVLDFIRKKMLTVEFKALPALDRLLYLELTLRASRYYFRTDQINGMRFRVKPGEFFSSTEKLIKYLDLNLISGIKKIKVTTKMMRGSLSRLESVNLIKRKNLKRKRGSIFSLTGWKNDQGPSEWHSEKWGQEFIDYPRPPLELSGSKK